MKPLSKNKFAAALTACICISLCFPAVSRAALPKPELPLTEETIQSALEEFALNWEIAENETQTITDEYKTAVIYTLRDPDKKQNSYSTANLFYCGINSGITAEGKRRLSMVLNSSAFASGKDFLWEDWKQSIALGASLYGGFDTAEAVYLAFSHEDVPEDMNSGYNWEIDLPGGFCTIRKSPSRHSDTYEYAPYVLWINFYESKELYEQDMELRQTIRETQTEKN